MRFDAAMMKIGGCHACMTCLRTGKACSFDDDFNIIAPHILDADAVVYAMPVYWYSISAQIKGVIDRVFSLVVGGKAAKNTMQLSWDGVTMPLKRTFNLLKWDFVGEVCIPGVYNVGDIQNTDGCTQAAALAEKF